MNEDCKGKILGSPEAQVVQTKEFEMDQPLLVCCFPSAGVVGTIAANTLIENFDMEEVAHVVYAFSGNLLGRTFTASLQNLWKKGKEPACCDCRTANC